MFQITGPSGRRSHCRLPIDDCRFKCASLLATAQPVRDAVPLIMDNRQSAMTKIISRDNSLLRRARAVRDGHVDELIFVEGLRLCEEALHSGLKIEAVIYSE